MSPPLRLLAIASRCSPLSIYVPTETFFPWTAGEYSRCLAEGNPLRSASVPIAPKENAHTTRNGRAPRAAASPSCTSPGRLPLIEGHTGLHLVRFDRQRLMERYHPSRRNGGR